MISEKAILIKDQIMVLIAKDFKLKYNSTALGFLWSLCMPIAQSLVYFFAFRVIMRFKVDNYLLYMLSGMFLWNFFCSSIIMSCNTFILNGQLIKKTSVTRHFLIQGTIASEFIHFALTIPILVILMIVSGIMPSWSFLFLPVVLINLSMFTLGCAFLAATINMYLRDLERIIGILLQLAFFLIPIVYPLESIPEKYRFYIKLNPFFYLLKSWRDIFYTPQIDLADLGTGCLQSTVILVIGYLVYRYKEPRLAEMV